MQARFIKRELFLLVVSFTLSFRQSGRIKVLPIKSYNYSFVIKKKKKKKRNTHEKKRYKTLKKIYIYICDIYLKNIYNYEFRLIVLQTLILISLFPLKTPPCIFFPTHKRQKNPSRNSNYNKRERERERGRKKYTSQSLIIFVIKNTRKENKIKHGIGGIGGYFVVNICTINDKENNIMKANTAATKIQANFRGYRVRKQLKDIKPQQQYQQQQQQQLQPKRQQSDEESLTSSSSTSTLKRQNTREALEEKSATKIQAGIRGYLVRKKQQAEQLAATRIQAGFRGFRTRKLLKQNGQ